VEERETAKGGTCAAPPFEGNGRQLIVVAGISGKCKTNLFHGNPHCRGTKIRKCNPSINTAAASNLCNDRPMKLFLKVTTRIQHIARAA